MELSFRKEQMSNEFTKYHLEGLPFNAVLHHFTEPDKGDPHDHPFGFTSIVLYGSYVEKVYVPNYNGSWISRVISRKKGESFYIQAGHIHKIESLSIGGCYTLIIPEQWEQQPSFYKFEDQVYYRQWNETEFKPYKI